MNDLQSVRPKVIACACDSDFCNSRGICEECAADGGYGAFIPGDYEVKSGSATPEATNGTEGNSGSTEGDGNLGTAIKALGALLLFAIAVIITI